MKETVLGLSPEAYRRGTQRRLWLCIAIAFTAAVGNVLLTVFRTDDNHSVHLILNIGLDIITGWFLLSYGRVVLAPRYRLYQLACANTSGTYSGQVMSVADQQEYHEGLACHRVLVGERVMFLPCDGKICLKAGKTVTLRTVGHFITEVTG